VNGGYVVVPIHLTKSLPLRRESEVLFCKMRLTKGPLKTEHLSTEVILGRYQQEPEWHVAQSFRWQVLLAVLKDELYVGHEGHGVNYKPQTLEEFLTKRWPRSD